MDQSVDASIKCLKLAHEAVGDCCFAWGVAADDSGTQRGEFIRPELWAEMLKPHYKRLCDWIHANTPWKVFLHSCGSIHPVIGRLIAAGVDCLHPLQAKARDMDAETLAKDFKGRIAFMGGIDAQDLMTNGTPEQIRSDVHRVKQLLGPNLIVSPSHEAILPNVPPENVEALAQAAFEPEG